MKVNILILISMTFFISISGMNNKVEIVDASAGKKLSTIIGTKPQKIGIFGATPSFYRYQDYCQTLVSHYTYLFEIKSQNKPIKKLVGKKVNSSLNRISQAQKKALQSLDHEENQDALINVFLNSGIDEATIKKNLANLIDTAKQGQILLHIFLPTYFAHCVNLEPKTVQTFLTRSAEYYKRHYKNIGSPGLKILIFIPPLHYFTSYMQQKDQQPLACINHVLTKEIFKPLHPQNLYGLINQNTDQNNNLIATFKQESYNIAGIPLYTFDQFGKPAANTFTPYLLKREHNDDIEKEIQSTRLITPKSHNAIMGMLRSQKSSQKSTKTHPLILYYMATKGIVS